MTVSTDLHEGSTIEIGDVDGRGEFNSRGTTALRQLKVRERL